MKFYAVRLRRVRIVVCPGARPNLWHGLDLRSMPETRILQPDPSVDGGGRG